MRTLVEQQRGGYSGHFVNQQDERLSSWCLGQYDMMGELVNLAEQCLDMHVM